jgi:hypothetical protein
MAESVFKGTQADCCQKERAGERLWAPASAQAHLAAGGSSSSHGWCGWRTGEDEAEQHAESTE